MTLSGPGEFLPRIAEEKDSPTNGQETKEKTSQYSIDKEISKYTSMEGNTIKNMEVTNLLENHKKTDHKSNEFKIKQATFMDIVSSKTDEIAKNILFDAEFDKLTKVQVVQLGDCEKDKVLSKIEQKDKRTVTKNLQKDKIEAEASNFKVKNEAKQKDKALIKGDEKESKVNKPSKK